MSKPFSILLCVLYHSIQNGREATLWKNLTYVKKLLNKLKNVKSPASSLVVPTSDRDIEEWLLTTCAGRGMEYCKGTSLQFLGRNVSKHYFFNWALQNDPTRSLFIPCALKGPLYEINDAREALFEKYHEPTALFVNA
jgi:hypothetical protein